MKAKRILFPTDLSALADAALRYATSLARDSGATLLIVHVETPPVIYGGDEMYSGVYQADVGEISEMLEKVVPHDPAVKCEHQLLQGDAATEIVRVAEEEKADMIVMATHGRTGLGRILMGSVAEAVVRKAPCPVFTLRHPERLNEAEEKDGAEE